MQPKPLDKSTLKPALPLGFQLYNLMNFLFVYVHCIKVFHHSWKHLGWCTICHMPLRTLIPLDGHMPFPSSARYWCGLPIRPISQCTQYSLQDWPFLAIVGGATLSTCSLKFQPFTIVWAQLIGHSHFKIEENEENSCKSMYSNY